MPNAQPYPTNAAYEQPLSYICGAVADVDLSTKQYLCVKRTTTGTIDVQTTAGGRIVGVLNDKPKAGQEAAVMDDGDTKVICGAAVAVDQALDVDVNGRVVPHTTGFICGYAKTAGSGNGSIIAMKLAIT